MYQNAPVRRGNYCLRRQVCQTPYHTRTHTYSSIVPARVLSRPNDHTDMSMYREPRVTASHAVFNEIRVSKTRQHLKKQRKQKNTSQRKTREMVVPTPAEKQSLRAHCTDGAQTSTTVSGRPSSVGLLCACANGARTNRYKQKQTIISQI